MALLGIGRAPGLARECQKHVFRETLNASLGASLCVLVGGMRYAQPAQWPVAQALDLIGQGIADVAAALDLAEHGGGDLKVRCKGLFDAFGGLSGGQLLLGKRREQLLQIFSADAVCAGCRLVVGRAGRLGRWRCIGWWQANSCVNGCVNGRRVLRTV